MQRERNTRRDGSSFDETTIQLVWEKASRVPGSPSLRRDDCGAVIERSALGSASEFGWEIDHVYPVWQGGSDNLANLIALHWENNKAKGDDYPDFACRLTR